MMIFVHQKDLDDEQTIIFNNELDKIRKNKQKKQRTSKKLAIH